MKGNKYLFLEVAMATNPFLNIIHFRDFFLKKKFTVLQTKLKCIGTPRWGQAERAVAALSLDNGCSPTLNKPCQILSEPMHWRAHKSKVTGPGIAKW